MDTDLLNCTNGDVAAIVDDPVVLSSLERNRFGRCTIEEFAGAVGARLAPHDIAVRLNESRDGTRLLIAWPAGRPAHRHIIPFDTVRLCSDQVGVVASMIQRSLDLAITD